MTKTKIITTLDLKPGNVILDSRKRPLIYLWTKNTRKYTMLWGAYSKDAEKMLKGTERRKRFYGLKKHFGDRLEIVGQVNQETVTNLNDIYKGVVKHNEEYRQENYARTEWKDDGYVLLMPDGGYLRVGQVVDVKFKYGPVACILGNKKGDLYNTRNGEIYVWPLRSGLPDPFRKHALSVHPKFIIGEHKDA